MTLTPFTHPDLEAFTSDTPMNETGFWKWLEANYPFICRFNEANLTDATVILTYLLSLGFIQGQHAPDSGKLGNLKIALSHYYQIKPHYPPCSIHDLFVTKETGTPFVRMSNATPRLKSMISKAGWVYDPAPDNCYLKIAPGNLLMACYQQILGSRRLCVIEDLPPVLQQE